MCFTNLGVSDVVVGLAISGLEDVGQLLNHSISDCISAENSEPKGMLCL